MTCRPDHPPRHPEFEAGNVFAVSHGADSTRMVALAGDEVRAQLIQAVPAVAEVRFALVLDVLVSAAVRHRLQHDFAVETALTKGTEKVPNRLWESTNATGRLIVDTAGKFGLSPTDEAKLAETTANAEINREELLRRLTRQGRAIRQAANRRGALNAGSREDS
jgi:hypothetical protein